MPKALYRNTGTNQTVFVPVGFFAFDDPLWELVEGGGGGGDVSQAELDALEADTTGPHGVPDFADLVTDDEATAKVIAHKNDADPHGDRGYTDDKADLLIPLLQKGAANGVATLGGDSKIPASQVPAISLTDYLGPVGDQAAMLALVPGQLGDWTIRTDLSTTWVISGADATQLSNWTELGYPNAVTSVAGHVGIVVLAGEDITSGTVAYARLPVGTTASTVAAGDVTTTALAGKVGKGALIFNVKDYGATGTGGNDTAAIQSAINAAATAGGRVYIPAGTYLVTPGVSAGGLILKPGLRAVTGDGSSSVLKVPNSVGEYYAILSNWDGTTDNDVGGLTIADLTIDQNNTNNQWATALAQYTIKPRFAVYIRKATSAIAVRNVTFTDLDGTNTVALSGLVRDHEISGCRFYWGTCPVDHDASVIYTHPAGQEGSASWILDNLFRSPGVGSPSARTAIETHGGSQTVRGNIIDAFSKGINLTGIGLWGGEGTVAEGNIITNTRVGIMLWSRPYTTNTTDGMRHCIVRDNIIKINGPGWAPVFAGAAYGNGILRDNNASALPFQDVFIENNSITYDVTGYVGAAGDNVGCGIEWRDSTLVNTDKRIVIRNNRIDSAPAAGIRWSVLGDSIDISGNTIRNPGQASIAAGGLMSNASANGLMINGALTNSSVSGNYVIDDQGAPTTSFGVYLFPTAAGSANNKAIDNRVPVANSKKIETVTSTHPGGWLIKMDHESYVAVTGQAAAGSSILDRSTGAVRTQTATPVGTSWSVSGVTYNQGAFIDNGYYVAPEGVRSSGVIAAANTEYGVPIWFVGPGTLVRIGVSVTVVTGVTAGTVIRLGIRADNGSGKPGTLILDAGTVAGDAVALAELTISQAIPTAGVYWLTSTCQLAGATLPTVRMLGTGGVYPVASGSVSTVLSGGLCGYTATGVTGALGSTYTVANQVALAPLIAVRG